MSSVKQSKQKPLRRPAESLQTCSFCRQAAAREIYRSQLFERGRQMLVVEQVPTMVCGNCGETYFTGGTLDELERILARQAEPATLRPVPVAQFSHSAA